MSKTSIALLCMFFIVLVMLIGLNTLYSSNDVLKSLPGFSPTQTVVSENTLSLSPSPLTLAAGKPATIQILIDSRGEKPSLLQMELAYDPMVLSSVTLMPGTFFRNPNVLLNKVNERNGRISYAIAPGEEQDYQSTDTVVATIQVTPRVNTFKKNTTLYFLPKTVVQTKNAQNTLKFAYGTKITVSSAAVPLGSSSGILQFKSN